MPVINHVNVVTRSTVDFETTADFFCDNFGFTRALAEPKMLSGAWVDTLSGYKNASTQLQILMPPGGDENSAAIRLLAYLNPPSPPSSNSDTHPNQPGCRHLGFYVPDIDAMYDKLKTQWKFISAPVVATGFNVRTCYFIGPQGIIIQLIQNL